MKKAIALVWQAGYRINRYQFLIALAVFSYDSSVATNSGRNHDLLKRNFCVDSFPQVLADGY